MSLQTMTELDRFFAETILKKAGLKAEEGALALGRLMRASRMGHLCQRGEDLGAGLDNLPTSIVEEGKDLFPKAPIVRKRGLYYLQKNWVYETYILEHALRLRKSAPPSYFDRSRLEENLHRMEGKLTPAQTEAIRKSLDQSLSLISGGPGTGKTYTAAHLVSLLLSALKKEQFYVSIAAPTGKAASHLEAAIGQFADPRLRCQTSTLHKLLKLQPGSQRLFKGERIDADLILVDEASMIDVPLLAHLLEAIGDESLLVLIGDPNQLPPVDAGSLFAEMSELFGVPLDRCMRTDDRDLQQLSEAVKRGDLEACPQLLPASFTPEELYDRIDPIVSLSEPDPRASFETYNRFRILNPIRQGLYGTDALNKQIFHILKNTGKWWAAPILAIANDPFNEIYNGVSGILVGHGSKEGAAYFPDRSLKEMRRFPSPPPFELGFCLSIHKSQGSEFEEILALFPRGSEVFGREALYTAITRAKRKIRIQGDWEIIQKMMKTSSRMMSGFSQRFLE